MTFWLPTKYLPAPRIFRCTHAQSAPAPIDGSSFAARAVAVGAIEYLAQHTGRATAVSAAKMIDYPTTHLDLPAEEPLSGFPD